MARLPHMYLDRDLPKLISAEVVWLWVRWRYCRTRLWESQPKSGRRK